MYHPLPHHIYDIYRYIYLIKYYSAIRKNKIFSFTGKWIELENIMLSAVSQVQKDKGCILSVICGS
jgi:hypothetical protein